MTLMSIHAIHLSCLLLPLAATEPGPGLVGAPQSPIMLVPEDLTPGVPREFPRFHFEGHEREAQLLSRYLWYHFSNRLGSGRTLFNQEYLATSDLWLGGAIERHLQRRIQDVHKDNLAAIELEPDGYVFTHQHHSHAHDHGWPFPIWCQVPHGPQGRTVGWHFQDNGPGWVWQYNMLRGLGDPRYYGETATGGWTLQDLESRGLVDGRWLLTITGPSPALVAPEGMPIDAYNCPFVQVRWIRPEGADQTTQPYLEWMREGDEGFSEERRVPLWDAGDEYKAITHADHFMATLYKHPQWRGAVTRLKIHLAPGLGEGDIAIDSIFTCYDTRHTINNPIYILACWEAFRWTGDVGFIKSVAANMRAALKYQQTEMGGLALGRIRNTWWGHDGRSGYTPQADGSKDIHPGHGIGSNYWDLLPFGWDDMYATSQYHAATLAIAELEEAIRSHPEWGIPLDSALTPSALRAHAERVRRTANELFFDAGKGRFVGCIDREGVAHDYGFTFLNLDAVWYGLASADHARALMDWIAGERIVEGDTSTGEDIYHWRFGPRATTLRNVAWYGQGWWAPESIPWGGQVQDGGAVLGFSFYDLWARLKVRGPEDAWQRLMAMLEWEDEVQRAGGYRVYYADGSKGTTLQGGGTAGGIGIDHEFYESSLVPAIIAHGFLGLRPTADSLLIAPNLPDSCPSMGIANVLCRGALLDVRAQQGRIEIAVRRAERPITVTFISPMQQLGRHKPSRNHVLEGRGVYVFEGD